MVSIDPSNISFQDAIRTTEHMVMRDLPDHVHVGPSPPGSVLVTDLPLKDLDPSSHSLKHFLDLVIDIPAASVDMDNIKAIIRDKAWHDLPTFMQMKERPAFDYLCQYFFVPQSDDSVCLLKHVYITGDNKVHASRVQRVLQGKGREIVWGSTNKRNARKALQWLLEQLGGSQFRLYSLSTDRGPTKASKGPSPEDAGWNFIMEKGEMDKGGLKQLRWIHQQINCPESPIHGWSEKLVQCALDSLANDGCVAKLCTRYDLTMHDVEPDIRQVLESIVPYLRNHSLWLLGEPGKGKTPPGRIIAMMYSRFHGGDGLYQTTCDLDLFRGIQFTKGIPALYDDGDIGNEAVKRKRHSQMLPMMKQ